jgi:hypothetical protein
MAVAVYQSQRLYSGVKMLTVHVVLLYDTSVLQYVPLEVFSIFIILHSAPYVYLVGTCIKGSAFVLGLPVGCRSLVCAVLYLLKYTIPVI